MAFQIEKIDVKGLNEQLVALTKHVQENNDQRYAVAMEIVETVTDIANTVSDVVKKWDDATDKAGLNYDDMPSSVLDYIDDLITEDKIKSAQDIIALFETGDLAGIIDSNNQINKERLAAFEKKISKAANAEKKQSNTQAADDEELF
jgi:hypothetical protein